MAVYALGICRMCSLFIGAYPRHISSRNTCIARNIPLAYTVRLKYVNSERYLALKSSSTSMAYHSRLTRLNMLPMQCFRFTVPRKGDPQGRSKRRIPCECFDSEFNVAFSRVGLGSIVSISTWFGVCFRYRFDFQGPKPLLDRAFCYVDCFGFDLNQALWCLKPSLGTAVHTQECLWLGLAARQLAKFAPSTSLQGLASIPVNSQDSLQRCCLS